MTFFDKINSVAVYSWRNDLKKVPKNPAKHATYECEYYRFVCRKKIEVLGYNYVKEIVGEHNHDLDPIDVGVRLLKDERLRMVYTRPLVSTSKLFLLTNNNFYFSDKES